VRISTKLTEVTDLPTQPSSAQEKSQIRRHCALSSTSDLPLSRESSKSTVQFLDRSIDKLELTIAV